MCDVRMAFEWGSSDPSCISKISVVGKFLKTKSKNEITGRKQVWSLFLI